MITRRLLVAVVVTLLAACGGMPTSSPTSSPVGTTAPTRIATSAPSPTTVPGPAFVPVGPMTAARVGYTATLLGDGRVLVAGGTDDASAEVYDPVSRTFTSTGSMTTPRDGHAAILLPDGRVLITGGEQSCQNCGNAGTQVLSSAELFDPSTGTFAKTGAMATRRAGQTAILLRNGLALVLGGGNMGDPDDSAAELYNPANGTFHKTGAMVMPRWGFTTTLLVDGRVLVAGGDGRCCSPNPYAPVASAELYDPATGTFSLTGPMGIARAEFTATLLLTGQVLIAGGRSQPTGPTAPDLLASGELFDPTSGNFTPAATMTSARLSHSATLLPSGRVLLVGGEKCCLYSAGNGDLLSKPELYDPSTAAFELVPTKPLTFTDPTVTLLSNGWLLLTGGVGQKDLVEVRLASAELFIEVPSP
jgi:hypothetical protein